MDLKRGRNCSGILAPTFSILSRGQAGAVWGKGHAQEVWAGALGKLHARATGGNSPALRGNASFSKLSCVAVFQIPKMICIFIR